MWPDFPYSLSSSLKAIKTYEHRNSCRWRSYLCV
jgi:hypothetical protein